eukprot:1078908-Rhodomonas_salina.2
MEEWSGALRDFRYSNMHFEMHRATDGLQPLSKGGNASQIDEESHRLAHADDGTWSVLVNIPRINWELAVHFSFFLFFSLPAYAMSGTDGA